VICGGFSVSIGGEHVYDGGRLETLTADIKRVDVPAFVEGPQLALRIAPRSTRSASYSWRAGALARRAAGAPRRAPYW
jgi:hypothetical protein